MLDEWRQKNCLPFERLRESEVTDGFVSTSSRSSFTSGSTRTVQPKAGSFDSRLGSHVAPAWPRKSATWTTLRLDLLKRSFEAMGYGEDESLVRARITYFHQIGQYAISFKEDPARDAARFSRCSGRFSSVLSWNTPGWASEQRNDLRVNKLKASGATEQQT